MRKKTVEAYKVDMDPEELEYINNRASYEALGDFLVSGAKVIEPKPVESSEQAENTKKES